MLNGLAPGVVETPGANRHRKPLKNNEVVYLHRSYRNRCYLDRQEDAPESVAHALNPEIFVSTKTNSKPWHLHDW